MSSEYLRALSSISAQDVASLAVAMKALPENKGKTLGELANETLRFLIACHAELERQHVIYWTTQREAQEFYADVNL